MPYSLDATDGGAAGDDADDESQYQGGPTVFDRRGSGADSYVPPVDAAADDSPGENAQAESAPEAAPDPTVLVYKDGHQIEIMNYAVVSQTLYDLTARHPRKIALADLDLPATMKANEDRGVTFELPASAQAN